MLRDVAHDASRHPPRHCWHFCEPLKLDICSRTHTYDPFPSTAPIIRRKYELVEATVKNPGNFRIFGWGHVLFRGKPGKIWLFGVRGIFAQPGNFGSGLPPVLSGVLAGRYP